MTEALPGRARLRYAEESRQGTGGTAGTEQEGSGPAETEKPEWGRQRREQWEMK